VLVGVGGVALGWDWADPVVGLVITAAILAVLWQAARRFLARNAGTFTATGSMQAGHTQGKATLLPDGQVLIAGGTLFDHPSAGHPGVLQILASAELYTP